MKVLFFLISFISPILCRAQVLDSVSLKWKLHPSENLSYLVIDNKTIHSANKTDSTSSSIDVKSLFYGPKESYSGSDTLLCQMSTKGNGIININWINYNNSIRPTGVDTATAFTWQESTSGDTVLRGSLFENGNIHSFYSTQSDYLAFYFELPNRKIKVGESWQVDFNVIYFDEGFICDSAYKLNSVTLSDVLVKKEDSIAIINYDLVEYVSGNYHGRMFGRNKVRMEFRHKATGEFSINKGRWLSYQATQTTETIGLMDPKTVSKVSFVLR